MLISLHGRLSTLLGNRPDEACRPLCRVRSCSRSGQGVTGDPPEIRIWVRGHAVRLIPNRPQITKLRGGPHHD